MRGGGKVRQRLTIRLGDEGCGSVDGQYNGGDDGAGFHVCESCVVDGQGRSVPLLYSRLGMGVLGVQYGADVFGLRGWVATARI
jgi:hypothetical protein